MDRWGKKRNKEIRWFVSPWVNLCYVVEGWTDGWIRLTGAGM